MRYQQSVQIQLQEKYRRLYKAEHLLYHSEAGYLVDYVESVPVLKSIVDRLERSLPDFDPNTWELDRRDTRLEQLSRVVDSGF